MTIKPHTPMNLKPITLNSLPKYEKKGLIQNLKIKPIKSTQEELEKLPQMENILIDPALNNMKQAEFNLRTGKKFFMQFDESLGGQVTFLHSGKDGKGVTRVFNPEMKNKDVTDNVLNPFVPSINSITGL